MILETDPLLSMNIIQNFAPCYESMCCTFVVLGDSSYVSYAVVNTTRKRNRPAPPKTNGSLKESKICVFNDASAAVFNSNFEASDVYKKHKNIK